MTVIDALLTDHTTDKRLTLDISHIRPRYLKAQIVQKGRTRNNAEVFTPSWICNKQNNLIDNAYFGCEGVFNTEEGHAWHTNPNPIEFPKGKTWRDYVSENVLEITCGEAPYLVSRYDTTDGMPIAVPDRIGLLDRKLRVISENVTDEAEWLLWAIQAVKSVYAYEYQADNLWLARKNIVQSVKEHFRYKYHHAIHSGVVLHIAIIASWNIILMDGLKMVVPNTCTPDCKGCKRRSVESIRKHDGIYAKTMNWATCQQFEFRELLK